ncbi:hypothetical protein ACQEVG_38140 [Streptomyces sp. CA-135486]|uniref:hypothetical protein n=1 Tax=Streptomyces sp. CA-135486 TaxID=3240049 RepID=UPI003D910106
MRWPWQRAARATACPHPRLLPSATTGVPFEATFTILWRPTIRTRQNLEELVRCDTLKSAAEIALRLEATDLLAAQDAINAALGAPDRVHTPHYRRLAAHVALRLSPESRESIAQQRADTDRVRRLRFLKTQLYEHPDLVVLDRLEQQPGSIDPRQVADWQRLARSIKACERWWYPLLDQWERLGQGFSDVEKQNQAMLALLDSLKSLNGGSIPESSGP